MKSIKHYFTPTSNIYINNYSTPSPFFSSCLGSPPSSLDDLIISSPPFLSLLPASASLSPPNLAPNALDIIFSFIYASRVAAGVGQKSSFTTLSIASAFLSSSEVLSNDKRYPSVEPSVVLNNVVSKIRASLPVAASSLDVDDSSFPLKLIVSDCQIIFSNRRFVQRIFCSIKDLLHKAVGCGGGGRVGKQNKANRKKLMLYSKKIEFYFAWSCCSSKFAEDVNGVRFVEGISAYSTYS